MSNSENLATEGSCVAKITPGGDIFDGDWFRFQISDMGQVGYEYINIHVQGPRGGPLLITLADEFSNGKKYEIRPNHYPLVKFNREEATSGVITLESYDRDAQSVHLTIDFNIGSGSEALNIQGEMRLKGFSRFEVTEEMRVRTLKHK